MSGPSASSSLEGRSDSPDCNTTGFLPAPVAYDRYENPSFDPDNVGAKLSGFIPRGAKVLDVGCGTGSVSEVVSKLSGARIIGIEPDADRARAARARGITAFTGYVTDSFLRAHGPFDVIMFADVLEHLANPAGLVLATKNALVPGGAIVASVPNVAHWSVRLQLLAGCFHYADCGIMDATHLRWFTRHTIQDFFQRLGFQITGITDTTNIELAAYSQGIPWRWMTLKARKNCVSQLVKLWPELFGCQVVVSVTPS